MNQNHPYDEHVITIKGALRWLIQGWKVVLLIAAMGALLLGGIQVRKQYQKVEAQKELPDPIEKEVKVKADEAQFNNVKSFVEYEEIVAQKQQYLDESILMKIDPMHKWVGSMNISFVFDDPAEEEEGGTPLEPVVHDTAGLANLYAARLREQEAFEQLREAAGIEEDVSYLNEVMTIDTATAPGTIGVTLSHNDRGTLTRLMDAIEAFINSQHGLGQRIGEDTGVPTVTRQEPRETVDTALLDSQNARKTDLAGTQATLAAKFGQLTDEEKDYLELYREAKDREDYEEGQTLIQIKTVQRASADYAPIFIKNAIRGFAITLIVCILVGILVYAISPVLPGGSSFSDMYGIRVLANIKKAEDVQKESEKLVRLVNVLPRDKKAKLAVISTRQDLLEREHTKDMLQKLAGADISVVTAYQIDQNPSQLEGLKDIKEALVLEQVRISSNRKIAQELQMCAELGICVKGAVLL